MKTVATVVLMVAGLVGGGFVVKVLLQQPAKEETPRMMRLYNQELPDRGHAQKLVP